MSRRANTSGDLDAHISEYAWNPDYHVPELVFIPAIESQNRSLQAQAVTNSPLRPRGLCGLSRKYRWAFSIIIMLVIIGALVGGLVGGLRKHNGNTPAASSTSPGPLAGSQLASLNWTDNASTMRRAVFYQWNGDLIMSHYHQENNSWTPYNLKTMYETANLAKGSL